MLVSLAPGDAHVLCMPGVFLAEICRIVGGGGGEGYSEKS